MGPGWYPCSKWSLFAAVDLGGSSDLAVVVVSDVVASAAVTEASAIVAVVSIVVSVGGIAVKAVESSGCDCTE